MAKPGTSGIRRIINAGKYSYKGLKAGLVNEAAFRQDCILSVVLIAAAFFVTNEIVLLLFLISGPFFILTAEILNSAIEAVVDRIGDEYNELSGRAKDMGSAAVFLMLTYTALIWILILGHVYLGWFA